MNGVYLFALFCELTSAVIVYENVAFKKINEVALTRSKWLSTFIIDTLPYYNFLQILYLDMLRAERAASKIEGFYNFPSKQDYHTIIKTLTEEIKSLENDRINLLHDYIDLHEVHFRSPRSLLPFIGKGLSYLFGTASESDLKTIRTSIDNLANNQKEITHVVDENISIINVTRIELKENRKTINRMVVSLNKLDNKLENITRALENEVFQMGQFVQLYLQLDSIIQVVRNTIWQAKAYMEHIQLQLNMLSLGHLSPSVISPKNLKDLLIEIESHLPTFLQLPYDPRREIWKLYKILTCTTVPEKGRFLVVVSIPLLDKNSKFEIYEIFNIPVPKVNQEIQDNNTSHMVAWYQLETTSIAINTNQMKYVLLTEKEKELCNSPVHNYCSVQSPLYSLMLSKLCVTALFLRDRSKVRSYCQTLVNPNSILPQAEYITDGLWFIATQSLITFSIDCPKRLKTTLQVKPPISLINLNMSCTAFHSHLTLLPYYHNESKAEFQDHSLDILQAHNESEIQIWKPITSKIPNLTKTDIPEEMKDTKEIPMRHLLMTVTKLRKASKLKNKYSLLIYLAIVSAISLTGICIITSIYYYYTSAKVSFRSAKNSSKPKKTPIYRAVVRYSRDRDDVTLEDVTSTQAIEDPMISTGVKLQQVQKEDDRSAIPVLKLATSN